MPVTSNPSFDPMGRGSAAVSGALAPFSSLGLGDSPGAFGVGLGLGSGGPSGFNAYPSAGLGRPPGIDPNTAMNMPGTDWSNALAKQEAELAAQRAAMGASTGGERAGYPNAAAGGTAATGGGKWATLDAMNGDIATASQSTNVPANLLKAILAIEGSYGSAWGQAPVTVGPDRTVNPFNGMMEATARANGYDWNRIQTDRAYAIWTSADVLQRLYATYGGQYGWDGVIRTYFSGNPAPSDWTDELGNNANAYHDNVKSLWDELNASPGGSTDASQPSVGSGNSSGSFGSIWGGAPANITFEFHGRGGPDLYGYGTAYGLDGSEHTGIDVGLDLNSKLYAPASGTVTCAGTDNGPGSGGGGCSKYQDVMGSGNGRIEIQLDNGAVIILGHTSVGDVHVGQHVNAGDLVGLSGGMNGGHVHVEARIKDPTTQSGWRIVDPRTILGGTGAPGVTTPMGSTPSPQETMQDRMYRIMTGG